MSSKSLILIAAAVLVVVIGLFVIGKPAGPNNCKSGDVSCDYTKGN